VTDTRSAAESYDALPDTGLLYDHVPAYVERDDIAFYVGEAERARGPVLELGSGTGRLLIPTARAGVTITGLDGSRHMLARCEEKLGEEPAAVRGRATLRAGDCRDFDLGGRFALVTAPFHFLQLFPRVDDQLRLLHAAARHLAPGGHLVLDVFNPSFPRLVAHDGTERDEAPAAALPDGRMFRRAYRVARVRWVDQVSETELIYYVAPGPGEPFERYVQAFDMRFFVRAELEHLLARAGFEIMDMYGDFAGEPLTDDAPRMVVRARRAS
jgi:SAM-dependent methyltransferase